MTPRCATSIVGAVLVVAAVTPATVSTAAEPPRSTSDATVWARERADLVTSTDPDAPLDDLAPLRRSIGAARVVGLGESVHGAAEETTLKHRTLRMLVE